MKKLCFGQVEEDKRTKQCYKDQLKNRIYNINEDIQKIQKNRITNLNNKKFRYRQTNLEDLKITYKRNSIHIKYTYAGNIFARHFMVVEDFTSSTTVKNQTIKKTNN